MASPEATKQKKKRKKQRAERAQQRARQRAASVPVNGKGKDAAPPKKQKSKLREWVDALLFAVIVMLIVRTLFFDLFRIPTPSMENNLLIGDYLFVSKLHYGTRTPMTLGIPFTQISLKGLELPWTRLPGFSEVKRDDAIVFNWPDDQVNKSIDRKTHYIKRVVGLPGETLEIREKIVHINGEAFPIQEGMQQHWYVYKKDQRVRLSKARLRTLGIKEVDATANPSIERILATAEAVEQIRAWPYIDRVEPSIVRSDAIYNKPLYPAGRRYTHDIYGPVTIPKKDQQVTLTAENWPVYEPVISRYEGHTTRVRPDGGFEIDGQPATTYTFAQDYFFVMGDNRDNSEDSRFWGFVPMDHVVGKAVLIYFSWDTEGSPFFFGQIRFDRLFNLIH